MKVSLDPSLPGSPSAFTLSLLQIVSQEDLAKHDAATFRGAVEGVAAGLAISLPGSWLLHKRVPYYRALPIQLKALGVILIVGKLSTVTGTLHPFRRRSDLDSAL